MPGHGDVFRNPFPAPGLVKAQPADLGKEDTGLVKLETLRVPKGIMPAFLLETKRLAEVLSKPF